MESPEKIQGRQRARQLAQEYQQRNDPTGWFDAVYKQANGNTEGVPWADMTVNPLFAEWLQKNHPNGQGKKALVVGCGLGDDAEALARQGFAVTAFDISPRAIAWCQQRFPDSTVNYQVANLFSAPPEWQKQFDFVLESYTLQALPEDIRQKAIGYIGQFVAPQGNLLIICRGRDAFEDKGSMPWPLTKEEMATFQREGLEEVEFEDFHDRQGVRRFRILYLGK
ncbi:MAG: class I SAM-dependent methyltransferase [Chloroflexota bacterium]|nr:class I SAM-dependent methyltransferase [Chloroflexota bacterium]